MHLGSSQSILYGGKIEKMHLNLLKGYAIELTLIYIKAKDPSSDGLMHSNYKAIL